MKLTGTDRQTDGQDMDMDMDALTQNIRKKFQIANLLALSYFPMQPHTCNLIFTT